MGFGAKELKGFGSGIFGDVGDPWDVVTGEQGDEKLKAGVRDRLVTGIPADQSQRLPSKGIRLRRGFHSVSW